MEGGPERWSLSNVAEGVAGMCLKLYEAPASVAECEWSTVHLGACSGHDGKLNKFSFRDGSLLQSKRCPKLCVSTVPNADGSVALVDCGASEAQGWRRDSSPFLLI